MKKKHIFLICLLTFIIVMFNAVSANAAEEHSHSLSESGEALLWQGISNANEITSEGNYYLKENITLSADLVIDERVNLCLNGHKIDVSELAGIKQVKVSESGILSICDCSGNDSGMITSARDTSTVQNRGKLNLYSGSLNRTVDDTTCIVKNEASAVMDMYGGKIYGTTVGVKNKGLFNIHGGVIKCERGALQLEGGETLIKENVELDCIGDDWATISLYGGTLNISGGMVKNSGGSTVIQLPYGESCLNISGGTITTSGKANCINAVSGDAELKISGGTIKNNYGSVSYVNNHSERFGWGINAITFKSLTLSGSPCIDNIYLYNFGTITIPDLGLQNEIPIGIFCRSYPLAFTNSNTTDYSNRFTCKAPNSAYILYNNSENQVVFAMRRVLGGDIGIEGNPNVGEVLTAVYTPLDSDETYTYQWYCEDVAIEGEIGLTYKVRPEDINKKIKVVVSGTGFYRETKTDEVTIVKTAVQYIPPTANRFEFNGTEQELVKAGECQGGVVKYSLSETGEFSEEIPKATNAGRYVVYYRAFGDAYHSDGAIGSVMARILTKDISNGIVALGESPTYNGAEQVQTVSSVVIDNLEVTFDVSGNKATDVKADGNYKLTVTGNGNFSGSVGAEWNIAPATPAANPEKPTTARVRRGKTLAEGKTEYGEFFGVDGVTVLTGTFEWIEPEREIREDSAERMKFIPDDTNYSEVEFDVEVDCFSSNQYTQNVTPQYTVTFDTNGGSKVQSVKANKNAWLKKPENPIKEGYVFDGWFKDETLKDEYVFTSRVTTNFTLYAKWSEDESYVTDEPEDSSKDDDRCEGTKDDGCPSLAFEDLDVGAWYHLDADYVIENGLFNGTTEKTFTPNGNMTRAMLVTVLYRAEGEPATNRSIPFSDVDMGMYYANAVSWAKQNGVITGVSENEFAPEDNITREQIAAIMHRYAQYKGYDVSIGENTNILSYADCEEISEYAISSMQYAVGCGLIKGRSASTLNPKDFATRVELAAIIHRFIEANN